MFRPVYSYTTDIKLVCTRQCSMEKEPGNKRPALATVPTRATRAGSAKKAVTSFAAQTFFSFVHQGKGVRTVAIGVGNKIDDQELLEIAGLNPRYKFHISDFDALRGSLNQILGDSCQGKELVICLDIQPFTFKLSVEAIYYE